MTYARTALQDFSTGNPVYSNAIVTAYTVDNGEKTSIKANLYAQISGIAKLANPQTLDSYGKFQQPVYIDGPVILVVTGLNNTPDHDTGIVSPPVTSSADVISPNAQGIRVAGIGTSLVQQSTVVSGSRISHSSRGMIPWARAHSKGRFLHDVWIDPAVIPGWEPSGIAGATRGFQGLNFGVSGQFADQIEGRLDYVKQNYSNAFDVILVDAGTNDMGPKTKEEIQATRERICNFFLDMGKIVIFLPILARDVSSWASGSAQRKKANWINQKTREFVKRKKNCYLFDWNEKWIDRANADGNPRSGVSSDGIHFSVLGGEDAGIYLAEFLSAIFPLAQTRVWSPDDRYDQTDNQYGNLLSNPFCTGNTGTEGTGASGDTATGMRLERSSGSSTVVGSKEARTDNRGEWQVMTYALSGSAEDLFYFRTASADTAHNLAGKWVVASCEAECNASDAIRGITMALYDQNGTNGKSATDLHPFDGVSNVTWPPRARSLLLETPPILLAQDSTTMRWRIEMRVLGSGTIAPIIKAGSVCLRQVDDPRVFVPQ